MLGPKIIDELMRRVQESLPEGIDRLQDDIQRNLRVTLSAALSRMDLVTREEFDVQAGVLAKTREKLLVLEQKVAALEQTLRPAGASPPVPREAQTHTPGALATGSAEEGSASAASEGSASTTPDIGC